jgi:membrane protein YdbS with pleckstrin-like domain
LQEKHPGHNAGDEEAAARVKLRWRILEELQRFVMLLAAFQYHSFLWRELWFVTVVDAFGALSSLVSQTLMQLLYCTVNVIHVTRHLETNSINCL